MISAVLGPDIWNIIIPVFGYPWYIVPVVGCLFGSLVAILRYSVLILCCVCSNKEARVSGTDVLSSGLNIAFLAVSAVFISRSKILSIRSYLVLHLLTLGIIFSKVTSRLVIAHMTRSEWYLLDPSLFGMVILFSNQCFKFFDEYLLLYACFAFFCVDLLYYLSVTLKQISEHWICLFFRLSIVLIILKLNDMNENYSPN